MLNYTYRQQTTLHAGTSFACLFTTRLLASLSAFGEAKEVTWSMSLHPVYCVRVNSTMLSALCTTEYIYDEQDMSMFLRVYGVSQHSRKQIPKIQHVSIYYDNSPAMLLYYIIVVIRTCMIKPSVCVSMLACRFISYEFCTISKLSWEYLQLYRSTAANIFSIMVLY